MRPINEVLGRLPDEDNPFADRTAEMVMTGGAKVRRRKKASSKRRSSPRETKHPLVVPLLTSWSCRDLIRSMYAAYR